MKSKLIAILTAAFMLGAIGCAQMQVSQRQKELQERMDPLMGKSEDDIVLALGVPRDVVQVGGLKVLKYYQSYGGRAQASAYGDGSYAVGAGRSWEAYDTINAYFQNGVMVKWDGYVQR